ncbi:MAG: hypothetical protein Q4B93_05400 [Clostridia bacterium]|nr:hypothetical protein [Clostridia bacterium]
MNDYSYSEIKSYVVKWYKKLYLNYRNKYKFYISKNESNILIVDFEFSECLAQLTVSNLDYSPYKYIYFEAVSLSTGTQIYCFFDDETTQKENVIKNLDDAFEFCRKYSI